MLRKIENGNKNLEKDEESANQTVLQPQNVNAILETAESGVEAFKEKPAAFYNMHIPT